MRDPRTSSVERRLSLAGLLAAALLGACGGPRGDDGIEVVRTDSAGVEIVTWRGADRPLDWSFEEVLRIGGEAEGPASFSRVGTDNFGADSAGNVYVLDADAGRVVVFGPSGEHLRSMGSEGGGPGEFQFPNGLSVSPGGIAAVFDIGKRSLVQFGPDGSVLPQVPFPHYTDPGVRHFVRTDGGIMTARAIRLPDRRALELIAWDDEAESDTTGFARIDYDQPEMVDFGCMGLALQPLFSPIIRWTVSAGRTAIAWNSDYRIDVVEADGPRRSIRRPIRGAPATLEDAIAESEPGMRMRGQQDCSVSAREVAEGRGFEPAMPAIRDVRLAEDGTLWVERFRPGSRTIGPPGIIDVFDPSGAYIGSLPEGTALPLKLLPDDRVATMEKDAFDIQRLVISRINRR